MSAGTTAKGASWLLESNDPSTMLVPERLSDEHRMIAQTAREFTSKEVIPAIGQLEQKDWALARRLLVRAGELGLLGADVPEEFGGVGLDRAAALVVASNLAGCASFNAAFGAQSNLSVTPILHFGTADQKQRYLPRLVSGEIVGAYALSESGSGSDALGAAARATPIPEGGFSLSGEKMWITNGGFADLFVVFAKVNGEQFTAFLVERGFNGVSTGQEEHKMGLHGSSTTPLILEDVHVPAANVLGEIGRGHKVAFNVLNFGRFKLGAMCLGGAASAVGESARYAASRRQFGKSIGEFGAIKHKIGEMTVRTYAIESLLYRTAGQMDAAIREAADRDAVPAVMEEFAIEASIAKVAGSETLSYVLDENVQIHGGNGFVSDYPAERHYRDARVNRIFEGTNEINRLLIPGMLIRRSLKGSLPLLSAAKRLQDEVMTAGDSGSPIESFKKIVLMMIGLALQRHGEAIAEQQEILLSIADIVIDTACAESAVMRSAVVTGSLAPFHADAAAVFVNDATVRIEAAARHVLAALAEGDTLRTHLAALRRLLKVMPVDTVVRRRRLADETIRRGSYIFQ